MEIIRADISTDKIWKDFLHSRYNLFYDYNFISYNDYFNKKINWHHLIFFDKDKKKVNAILNGCEKEGDKGKAYISCNGVSFGGFRWREKLDVLDYIKTIREFKSYLTDHGFAECVIRNQPFIYGKNANEEYEYALIHEGFSISSHSITNIIELNEFEFDKLANPKKRAIQKSENYINIELIESGINSESLKNYYEVLLRNRELKNVKPTHSLEELVYLKKNVPEKILLFSASISGNIAGICILFIVKEDIVLNFYLAADEAYKKERVSDFILYKSIEWAKEKGFRLYDIGTSNIGSKLLDGLFEFKKKFMANGYLRKTFSIKI